MSFYSNKRQPFIIEPRFSKALGFIPSIILATWLILGAAAGHSALDRNSDPGQTGQADEGTVASAPKAVKPRSALRGMQAKAAPAPAPSLPAAANVLDKNDEDNYRLLFTYLQKNELSKAEAVTADIKDGVLLGIAQAQFFLNPRNTYVSYDQLREWLTHYADLPQASDIYKKALSLRIAGQNEVLPQPEVQNPASVNAVKPVMAEPVEWKKPRDFAADALWRSGQFAAVLEALKDVQPQQHTSFEQTYPLWVKGLAAFATQDFALAAKCFTSLLDDALPEANRAAVAFWAARSFEKNNESDRAAHYFEMAAASPRSFYGVLAMARNDKEDAAGDMQARVFTKRHATLLKQSAVGLRVLALLQIGERDLAEKEASALSGKSEFQNALIALGNSADMPNLSAHASTQSGQKQANNTYTFPAMPWRPTGGFLSDPALVMAIAWNESRFVTTARNPSGASGVMQIMPSTAEHVVAGSSARLFDPQTSVTVGDQYIQKLSVMNGIDGNLLLVIAGYNCGPGKVQQLYQDARHANDPLLFLETMPLKETHDYVQKVLTTYASYRLRLGKPLSALAELSKGQWPNYAGLRTASK